MDVYAEFKDEPKLQELIDLVYQQPTASPLQDLELKTLLALKCEEHSHILRHLRLPFSKDELRGPIV